METYKSFTWQRHTNGVLDCLDIWNADSVLPQTPHLCMMDENKHRLATNLRACFGFLTLHKSTLLASAILKGESE
tara:strand:- start:1764 stop:1988 length:225 start_codon:yes stop_codon:yes gene_type:complete